jgi:farnesyl diphosphate synthase
VHRAFDEATAILAGRFAPRARLRSARRRGDARGSVRRVELIAELARASGPSGMAGGQMMDLAAERTELDLAAVTRLQQ